ncbi:iron donor protein CyaY [Parasalinivibrio latis]|uniref:iron donor protein CyaY n=1 Tax=Parasalinivibrio latis TaxID=2952610 RepID=UPI0030DEE314
MNSAEYHEKVEEVFSAIEEGIDESGADVDYETSGNVLTLEFDDRSQIIINKQEAMSEIWLASRSGGYHCSWKDGDWRCSKTGLTFMDLVKRECSLHAGEEVDW